MPKFQERFARQYLYEPPSEFPLTSLYSGKVRHLSGLIGGALTQNFHETIQFGRWCSPPSRGASHLGAQRHLHLHYASGLATPRLAPPLNSLVRVSRRVNGNQFASILSALSPRPAGAFDTPTREGRRGARFALYGFPRSPTRYPPGAITETAARDGWPPTFPRVSAQNR